MTFATSRRGFLLGSCSLLGAITAGGWVGLSPAFAAGVADRPDVRVGFAGSRLLQVTLVSGRIDIPAPRDVGPEDKVSWAPDPWNRRSGAGQVNDEAGVLSGNQNTAAPQQFQPWPTLDASTVLTTYSNAPGPGDDPANWTVLVNGTTTAVVRVFRKSFPIYTATVAPAEWVNTAQHLITLELGSDVPVGATLTVSGPDMAQTGLVREAGTFSEVIHVCQEGYPLRGPKKAHVGLWLGHDRHGEPGNTDAALTTDTQWRLVAEDGSRIAEGHLTLAKPGNEPHAADVNFNGSDIYEADFSDAEVEGRFHLEVDGLGASFGFPVAVQPYLETLRLAGRFYYHKRSGIAIEEPYGEGVTRPRNGHPEDGLTVWQTTVRLGETSEGHTPGAQPFDLLKTQPRDETLVADGTVVPPGAPNPHAWGGWHDASDWDRRISQLDAVTTMADLVELFPVVRDVNFNLPESGRTFADPAVAARKDPTDRGDGSTVLPDLIHEALWGISIWRRTQHPDGGIIGGVEYSSDGIGGSVSWNPIQLAFAYAPEPYAAWYFAMVAARLGHVIKHTVGDAVLGDALLSEALLAWDWAEAHWPETVAAAGTVEQVNRTLRNLRVGSAATLYRTTGHAPAKALFEAHNPFLPQSDEPGYELPPGLMSRYYLDYTRAGQEGRHVDRKISAAIYEWVTRQTDWLTRMGSDYGLHSAATYPFGPGWLRFGPGSNWRAEVEMQSYAIGKRGDPLLLPRIVEGLWFGLGSNPANVTFVQSVGSRQFGDPSMVDRNGLDPIPGSIVFGVAGGPLHPWEYERIAPVLYPLELAAWPVYAQIFESSTVLLSSEHGSRANVAFWLLGCGFAHHLLARPA